MRIVFFVFLLSFLNGAAHAGDILDENGNSWNNYSNTGKLYYVTGFISASIYTSVGNHQFELNKVDEKSKNDAFTKYLSYVYGSDTKLVFTKNDLINYDASVRSGFNKRLERYSVGNISVGQLVEGLDELYKDFKNRNILIIDGIHVVKRQISGTAPEEIEKYLLFLRSGKTIEAQKKYLSLIPGSPFGGFLDFP